jgi:predicted kinase
MYRDTARNLGARVELHYLSAPFNTLWERVSKRNQEPNEFNLTKKELENAYNYFQPPSEQELKTYDTFQTYIS